ncbi:MAG TPA: helix-turn-helix transcriptional regulator [Halomicronema sp.]|jgi:putative transcriptional regulator
MGLIRLKIYELASERGWTIKQVADFSGVPYTSLVRYANSAGLASMDVTSLHKLARVFDVLVEDMYEIVRE